MTYTTPEIILFTSHWESRISGKTIVNYQMSLGFDLTIDISEKDFNRIMYKYKFDLQDTEVSESENSKMIFKCYH